MHLRKSLINPLLPVLVSLVLATGLIYADWTEPTDNPPNSNVPAPINVGSDAQAKEGGLIVATGAVANGFAVANGNVGIGTTSPTAKLDVVGNVKILNSTFDAGLSAATNYVGGTWNYGVSGTAEGGTLQNYGVFGLGRGNIGSKVGVYGQAIGAGTNYGLMARAQGGATNWGLYVSAGNAYFNNNVGIGTTTPGSKLTVAGEISASGNKIINVATPTAGTDAVNKDYVDAQAGGGCYTSSNANCLAGFTNEGSIGGWKVCRLYAHSCGVGGACWDTAFYAPPGSPNCRDMLGDEAHTVASGETVVCCK